MFWYLYPEMETKFQMVDIMLSAMSMEDWKEGPGKEEMKKEEEPEQPRNPNLRAANSEATE